MLALWPLDQLVCATAEAMLERPSLMFETPCSCRNRQLVGHLSNILEVDALAGKVRGGKRYTQLLQYAGCTLHAAQRAIGDVGSSSISACRVSWGSGCDVLIRVTYDCL